MKLRSLCFPLVGLALTLGTWAVPEDSLANRGSNYYSCAKLKGTWTTWVHEPNGTKLPLVEWTSNKIRGWTPKARCVEVAKRIQSLSDNGVFNHMKGDNMNGLPVICGVRNLGDSCNERNLIMTLGKNDDPNQAINQLLDISARARGDVMRLDGKPLPPLRTYINGQLYVNMEAFQTALAQLPPQQ